MYAKARMASAMANEEVRITTALKYFGEEAFLREDGASRDFITRYDPLREVTTNFWSNRYYFFLTENSSPSTRGLIRDVEFEILSIEGSWGSAPSHRW